MKPQQVTGFRQEYDPYYDMYRTVTYYRDETNEEIMERNMSRRTFRLLKDTDFLAAGTLVQEDCDDGNQQYSVLDFDDAVLYDDFDDFEDYELESHSLSRKAVEENPEWYEEVEMTWTTKIKQAVKRATKKGKR